MKSAKELAAYYAGYQEGHKAGKLLGVGLVCHYLLGRPIPVSEEQVAAIERGVWEADSQAALKRREQNGTKLDLVSSRVFPKATPTPQRHGDTWLKVIA